MILTTIFLNMVSDFPTVSKLNKTLYVSFAVRIMEDEATDSVRTCGISVILGWSISDFPVDRYKTKL